MVFFFLAFCHKKQNRNNEALIAAAYVVGVKFFRMTDGNPCILNMGLLFYFIGMYYNGFRKVQCH
jgi:hypothetical protein